MSRYKHRSSYSRSPSRKRSWSRNSRTRSRSLSNRYTHRSINDNNPKRFKEDSRPHSNNLDSTSDNKSYSSKPKAKSAPKRKPFISKERIQRVPTPRSSTATQYFDEKNCISIRNLPNSLCNEDELSNVLSKLVSPLKFTFDEVNKSVFADYGTSEHAITAFKDLSNRLKGCKVLRVSQDEDVQDDKCETDSLQDVVDRIASIEQKKKDLIKKYSEKLKEVVSNLSNSNEDERKDLLDQINNLKNKIKVLNQTNSEPMKQQNSIDNRSPTLIFETLPECAQGPGKLAKWITENEVLQGQKIVSLKKQDKSVLITYNSPSTAHRVKNACSLYEANFRYRQVVNQVEELKSALWNGVPEDAPLHIRVEAWQLALGYLPKSINARANVKAKKHEEYHQVLLTHYLSSEKTTNQLKIANQIKIDLPRTFLKDSNFQNDTILSMLERILYIWSIRNPASGYVQGINDIAIVFIYTFTQPHLKNSTSTNDIPKEDLDSIEADSYFCLSKFLSQMQDNYTDGQPGIHRAIAKLEDIINEIDKSFYENMYQKQIQIIHVTFRWINCLLLRELPLSCSLRLWDTLMAESGNIMDFHLHVCAVMLLSWRQEIVNNEFQHIMLFLQSPPSKNWEVNDINDLLAKTFVLLKNKSNSKKVLDRSTMTSIH